VLTFAGPIGALLAGQGRLYSITDGATQVWDPTTGERTAILPDVTPTRLHQRTGELAAITTSHIIRWATTPVEPH
jgi:hypothetical protein